MTLANVFACTAYAWTTKGDFSIKWGLLWVFGMTLFMLGFFSIFFSDYIMSIGFCALGALLFGIYFIIDTYLI